MNDNYNFQIIKRLLKCLKIASHLSQEQIENYDIKSNYFDENVLDSLAFMLFVIEIEKEFDLSFKPEHMQSYEFQSISGVAIIIESLLD